MSASRIGARLTCRICGSAAIVTTWSAEAEPACCGEPLRGPGEPVGPERPPPDAPPAP